MPVPVELHNTRHTNAVNALSQDVSFDINDFQLCAPQTDSRRAFEPKELEANFCRDFSCCGLILSDLHDLLQHYEEYHVRLEDDESCLFSGGSSFWSPQLSYNVPNIPSSPVLDVDMSCDVIKKRGAAYLSDLYNTSMTTLPPTTSPSVDTANASLQGETGLTDETIKTCKKRSYSPSDALDLLTRSAAKRMATAVPGDLQTPILADDEFLAQADAIIASANASANSDKPYKCRMPGCQKAYKNPNGLKYHNQHGHCDVVSDENENAVSKPYRCTLGDCGKRYKNLNGLKYHIEHSHMAVLNHTLANFGVSIFTSQAL